MTENRTIALPLSLTFLQIAADTLRTKQHHIFCSQFTVQNSSGGCSGTVRAHESSSLRHITNNMTTKSNIKLTVNCIENTRLESAPATIVTAAARIRTTTRVVTRLGIT